MKQFFWLVVFLTICAFADEQQKTYPIIKNESFSRGEVLEYRVNFGFLTIGKAITKVDAKSHIINARPCYKIDAFGETTSISWIYKVKDNWGAYIDTAAMVTHVSYRKIRENSYRKDEQVVYDHNLKKARVRVMNKETGVYENTKEFDITENATDLVGGFIQLRFLDFSKVKLGDTLSIHGFFEDTSYNLKILYKGRQTVSTSLGKIPCHLLVPVMPDNKLFNGPNSIRVWISDDQNRIPVKIQAKMFIGHTGVELTNFRGLRNQLRIIP